MNPASGEYLRLESHVLPAVALQMKENAGLQLATHVHRPILDATPGGLGIGLGDCERRSERVWEIRLRGDRTWSTGEAVSAAHLAASLIAASRDSDTVWLSRLLAGITIEAPDRVLVRTRLATPWLSEMLRAPQLAPRRRHANTGAFRITEVSPRIIRLQSRAAESGLEIVTTTGTRQAFEMFDRGELDLTDGLGVEPRFWNPVHDDKFEAAVTSNLHYELRSGSKVSLGFAARLVAILVAAYSSRLRALGVLAHTGGANTSDTGDSMGRECALPSQLIIEYASFAPNAEIVDLLVMASRSLGVHLIPVRITYGVRRPLAADALRLAIVNSPTPHGIGRFVSLLGGNDEISSQLWASSAPQASLYLAAERALARKTSRLVIGRLVMRYRNRIRGLVVPASSWTDFEGVGEGSA